MTPALWAAAATCSYFVATAGVLQLFNLGVPRAVEQVLSALISPAVLLMAVWSPLLRRVGLARGDWFTVPTLPGFVLLTALYTVLAFVITATVLRALHR